MTKPLTNHQDPTPTQTRLTARDVFNIWLANQNELTPIKKAPSPLCEGARGLSCIHGDYFLSVRISPTIVTIAPTTAPTIW